MAYIFILIGSLLRVLPHAANFAPIGAIALFGGVYLNRKAALIVPLAAMIISDVFIGFDSIESRLTVYGAFLLIGLVGMLVSKRKNVVTVLAGSVSASVIFYLVTNFAFFYPATMYAHNWVGIVASYTNAIPFFRPTLTSDLLYTAVFFGVYEAVKYFQYRTSLSFEGEGMRER